MKSLGGSGLLVGHPSNFWTRAALTTADVGLREATLGNSNISFLFIDFTMANSD